MRFKNCFEGGCDRCNSDAKQGVDLDKCMCIHAEESALLETGLLKGQNAIMYCTLQPCIMCTKLIIHCVASHSS